MLLGQRISRTNTHHHTEQGIDQRQKDGNAHRLQHPHILEHQLVGFQIEADRKNRHFIGNDRFLRAKGYRNDIQKRQDAEQNGQSDENHDEYV
ncbi:hypothetical protein D3C80_1596870 [compost metagenome]